MKAKLSFYEPATRIRRTIVFDDFKACAEYCETIEKYNYPFTVETLNAEKQDRWCFASGRKMRA